MVATMNLNIDKNLIHWHDAANETFSGRDALLKTVQQGLDRGDSFAILGQVGMGKSMLLNKIKENRDTQPGSDPVCVILRQSGKEENAYSYVEKILNEVAKVLAAGNESEKQRLIETMNAVVSPTVEKPILRMIDALEARLKQPVSVELFFDDMHRMRERPWATDLLANLGSELFGHHQNTRHLRAIFCGDVRVRDLLASLPFSDIWQRLREIWLEPLSEKDISDLVQKTALSNVADATMLLSKTSGGYPSVTQYLLRDLLESPNQNQNDVIQNSSTRFIGELSKMLDSSWGLLSDDARILVQTMATLDQPLSIQDLARKLSTGVLVCTKVAREAASSGFIRKEGDTIMPSGKLLSTWLTISTTTSISSATTITSSSRGEHTPDFPTILHLTDLHFGGDGHAWNQSSEIPGVGRPPHDRITLLDTLLQNLKFLSEKNEKLWPKLVIVSGDLIFQCHKEGIKSAVNFLADLSNALGIQRNNIILCPGNHEQNRLIFVEEPKAQLASYVELWNTFYPSGFPRLPLEWSPDAYVHLYNIDNLEILSLNSCEDLDPGEEKRSIAAKEQGYIGVKQLKAAAELLVNKQPTPGHIRVAVLHHHLSQHKWSTGLDYSILKEVERVIKWLSEYNFDLVFHGHQHCSGLQTRVEKGRYLTILAGGSAGVAAKYRWRGGMPLMYQLVYSNTTNEAIRLCQSFDLFSEAWVENSHEPPQSIPLGTVTQSGR
jgi:predicted MPP superfamily phosphohydrolase